MPNVGLLPVTRDPQQLVTYIEENFRRIAAAMALPVPAASVTPGAFPSGDITIDGNVFLTDGKYFSGSSIELRSVGANPYIDFTRTPGSADFDVRLINDNPDTLAVQGGRLYIDGVEIRGTPGRNYFKDSELSAGAGLRVGAAWGRYGIYSESGDVTVGSANARFSIQNDEHWFDGNGMKTKNTFAGQSGAHGGSWAQFSAHSHWNSSGRYGIMHNTGDGHLLLSSYQINFRIENSDRLLIGNSSVEPKTRLAMYDNLIYTRAWNDDWHVHGWWSGNDGLRITEYGGLYFRVRDMDPAIETFAYASTRINRWDQLGGWDTGAIQSRSGGGGSPTMVSFWESGRNAAHLIKSWFSALECRSWDNAGWGIFRGELEDYSSIQSKNNVRRAVEKLPKTQRKEKVKKISTAHFNRKRGGCANCMGTGLNRENRRVNPKMSDHEVRDALPVIAGLFGGTLDESPCPDCNGQGRAFMHEHDRKNEEAGWFGFISEEVAVEFPEAVYYRPSESDQTKIEVSGISVQALVAILWEEVKDLEDRLIAVEGKAK